MDITALTPDEVKSYLERAKKSLGEDFEKYPREQILEAVAHLSYKNAPKEMPKKESETKPTLYIFRHGQTTDNKDFIFSGWRDAELTEKGIRQALELAEKIKDKKIQMLISSPQIRAIETMKHAISKNEGAKNLEIHKEPRIKERHYGDYQGKSKLEIYMKDREKLASVRRSYDNPPPNGESVKMVCARVADFCDEIVPLMKKEKINVAISCHGNSIRGFRKYFENLSDYDTAHVETPLGQDYLAYVIE